MNKMATNKKNDMKSVSSPLTRRSIHNADKEESECSESASDHDFDETDNVKSLYPRLESNLNHKRKLNKPSPKSPDSCVKSLKTPKKLVHPLQKPNIPERLYPDLSDNVKENPYLKFWYFSVPIILVLGIIIVKFVGKKEDIPIQDVKQAINTKLKTYIQNFDQSRECMTQIYAQVNDMLDEVPLQPSILLAVVPHESNSTAECLIGEIAKTVSDAFGDGYTPIFDVEDYVEYSVDDLKHHLENTLSELSYSHCAIVKHLELLRPEASIILHAFCDNENAHHKQALIIFVLSVADSYNTCLSSGIESFVEEKLYSLWSNDLKREQIAAIYARIGNAPILIKPARKEILQLHCS